MPVTIDRINEELESGWHVLHLLAHGVLIKKEHLVYLEADSGKEHRIPARELGQVLGASNALKLAVLATCDGFTVQTKRSGSRRQSALEGLGVELIEAGRARRHQHARQAAGQY